MIPELAKLIGKYGEMVTMEVEAGSIRKFADAVGDYNPLYWDEEYARHSRYQAIIAPPGFFGWPKRWTRILPTLPDVNDEVIAVLDAAGYNTLDGGIAYEFFYPIRAGDTVTALSKIAAITEREGKSGKLYFIIVETKYVNQTGHLAATAQMTLISFLK